MNSLELIAAAAGFFLFITLSLLFTILFGKKVDLEERVRLRVAEETPERESWRNLISKLVSVFKPLGEIIPRSPEEMSAQETRLVQAGIRRKDAVVLFHAAQVGLALVLLVLCISMGYIYKNVFIVPTVCILAGVYLPKLWLTKRVDARRERIQLAIPDALDLVVVCVEAGLGLDQALHRIGTELRNSHPDLSEELKLRNIEINFGRSRAEAFRNFAERTDSEDIRSLVAILIQTERYGTSVGQALRVFAESMRIQRQQRARERAAKLPIKMIPVMILFIFPSIFVVVVGPGVIKIIRGLLPILSQ